MVCFDGDVMENLIYIVGVVMKLFVAREECHSPYIKEKKKKSCTNFKRNGLLFCCFLKVALFLLSFSLFA